ncbi:hypothetical protein KFE25_012079 [Diacronema lutheri]|uniref:S-formylglutathione hydrolase n=1 Tax=Diacronema lutheri TaxID=2081491 RepID=A0A8J5XKK2_DIALT|nr:hypothetical protein KFE25_012079 [Diacronema lutheri]
MAVFTLALCAMFALRATGEPAKLRRPLATRLSTRRPASARALSRGTLPATEAAPYGVGTVTPGEPIKCRAAVAWGAKQPIKIEEVWVDPPKEGEVRVRVIANALCHTDMYTLDGEDPEGLFPCILGHEAGAVVVDVGPGVTSVAPGDRVIPCYTPECRRLDCIFCQSDKTNLCPRIRGTQGKGLMPDGTSRFRLASSDERLFHFMGCSTFSEFTVLAEISCAKISPAAPLEQVCLLGCGVATGWGAVWNTVKVEAGSTVAVFGLGAVGLAVVQAARIAGAREIFAIDVNAAKFDAARELGASVCINPRDLPDGTSIVAELQRRTSWGVDYTFDATGSTQVMRDALEAAHRGWGVSCVIGVAGAGKEIATRPFQLVTGRTWKGTAFGGWKSRTHVPQLVRRVLSGELPVHRYITHTFDGLEGTQAAIDALHSGDCLRAVVRYAPPPPPPPPAGLERAGGSVRLLSERRAAGGTQLRLSHESAACGCTMSFSIFLPSGTPPPSGWPSVCFLSGLTCTDENVVQKGGFQQHAARLGLAVLCPDTSPRGDGVAGCSTGDWALGEGASFYVDATRPPFSRTFRMESYLKDELLPLAARAFALDSARMGVSGFSMGGHGALTLFWRHPGLFKSASAFAPICNPTQGGWGRAAFAAYLGSVEAGKAHDACELVRAYSGPRPPVLVDQGAADEYLRTELMPAQLQRACAEAGYPLKLRTHAGYDHSFLFVASFIAEHLEHHAAQLAS